MFFYIALALSPTIIYFLLPQKLFGRNKDNQRKFYLCIFGVCLFLMIALRHYAVGSPDSLNYYENWETLSAVSFDKFKSIAEEASMEYGYLFSVWIFSKIFIHPQWVFVLSGLIFTLAVCRFLYKNCGNLLLGTTMFVCLGLYTFMVQGLRQSIAMSICLFAIEFCKKRDFKGFLTFVFLVLFAAQYHQTAIVFLPMYFLYGKKLNSVWTLVILIGYAAILFLSKYIIDFANELFERDYNDVVESGGLIAVAIYFIIIFFGLFLSKKEDRADNDFSFFIFMTAIGAVVFLMRYFSALAAERISFYFMFGQLIVLPNTGHKFESKSKTILTTLIILLSVILFVYRLSSSELVPYLFFWQEV